MTWTRLAAALLSVLGAVLIVALVARETRRSARPLAWPDSAVKAVWPTFTTIPLALTGAGDSTVWNGSFSHCVRSPRISSDYACTYADGHQTGYVCVATHGPRTTLSASELTARVAPGDTTYRSAKPPQVCDSALAAQITFG